MNLTPEQKKEHARKERVRRANWTPEQREAERLRSNRRYAEGKKNPEWLAKKHLRSREASERARRRAGVPKKTSDPEQIRRNRRAKEARYWRRSLSRRLSMRLRSRVRLALNGATKSARTFELLGCSLAELLRHLQSLFRPGMTWENYGPVWHIDHKKPCAAFNLTDPKQQRACFHWTNLQPLFALDNLRKGAR